MVIFIWCWVIIFFIVVIFNHVGVEWWVVVIQLVDMSLRCLVVVMGVFMVIEGAIEASAVVLYVFSRVIVLSSGVVHFRVSFELLIVWGYGLSLFSFVHSASLG